jgi:hypothetical protein
LSAWHSRVMATTSGWSLVCRPITIFKVDARRGRDAASGKESVSGNRKLTEKFTLERPNVRHPDESQNTDSVEPARLQLILLRLGHRYYDAPPASSHIATSVWADLTDSEERSSVLS